VSFGLGWAVDAPIDAVLRCEGSQRPERPAIDFTLEITARCDDASELPATLQRTCLDHSVFGKVARERGTVDHNAAATAMADGEVRGGVPASLRGHGRGVGRLGAVLCVLQPREAPSVPGLAHAA